jgi:hypothetical protein
MNDFTKEELEILQKAMNYWAGEHAGKVIKNKIQSMIDNYCEHDCKETIFKVATTSCSKCGYIK